MSTDQIHDFDVRLLIASKTNPRTTFDPAYIDELGKSIARHKMVQQPILCRPLPADRMEETAHLKPRPTHEIVFGECRWRGSVQNNMPTIRAMVRPLNNAEVLELQLVENLRRKDLSELEEAEGYQRLMTETNINADAVGKMFEKSRAYVYARLKLLDLGSEGRAALRSKKIEASTALLIARIPDSKLQATALKDVLSGEYDYQEGANRSLSYRSAQRMVQTKYMLKLSDAVFDTTCPTLLKVAGTCTTCPKRTGYEPELFSDVKSADVCIDPPCFHKKEEAHTALQVAAAQAKGQTVISGREAAELRGNGYADKLKGYRRLDSVEDSPSDAPLRKLIGKQMQAEGIKPVLIENPRKPGDMLECLTNEVVLRLLKAVQVQAAYNDKPATKEVQKLVDDKKTKAEAKAKEQYEQAWRNELLANAWSDLNHDAAEHGLVPQFTKDVHRYLVVRAANSLSTPHAESICKLLDLGKVSPIRAVADFARETPHPELLQLLIIMVEASSAYEHAYNGRTANEGLLLVAGIVFGVQLDSVVKEIKAETKAKIWPKVEKPAGKNAPAAQAKHAPGEGSKTGTKTTRGPVRKPKASAEEAMSGIAQAMQDADRATTASPEAQQGEQGQGQLGVGFAVGQVVKVTTDSNKFGARLTMHKWLGKRGTITGRTGQAWDVTFKGRSGGVAAFDADEISLVEGAAV